VSATLEIAGLDKEFHVGAFLARRRIDAVKGVSFMLNAEKPEIFAIVGESGSGKSTLARMILGNEIPTSGTLRFEGRDIGSIRGKAERLSFMGEVQPIFQNPFEAFNPLTPLDFYLFVSAKRYRGARTAAEQQKLADESLQLVGLSLAEVKGRYSHELSGGQLQRVAVNLFQTLRDELKVSIIYITHDLATAYYIADRVIIMRRGEVVEAGVARDVLANPKHPYSIALRNAVLPPDPAKASAAIRERAATRLAAET
jgi:ABC-type oligopeptide transport system ATPase subunit